MSKPFIGQSFLNAIASSSSSSTTTAQPQLQTQRAPTTQIDREILSRFKPSKVFKDALEPGSVNSSGGIAQISSITFDDTGEKCVTAGEDEAFTLWDSRQGKKLKTFYSKKYGISHARFTHRSQNIIHASTKGDDHAIRYHSMHDNKYLSYFKGHTAKVRSLHMSPRDDTFASAGDDGTVRLWDLRQPTCKDIGGSVIACFDNAGDVMAVACSDTSTIALYAVMLSDVKPFLRAPFVDPVLEDISTPPPRPIITSMSFSNNGHYLLVGTSSNVHYLLDAYDLIILRRLVGHQGLGTDNFGLNAGRGTSGEEVGWIGNSQWIVSGSADGSICFWDISPPPGAEKILAPAGIPEELRYRQRAETIQPSVVLQESTDKSSRAVKFNPRFCMLAMGGDELSFWLPAKDEDAKVEEGW